MGLQSFKLFEVIEIKYGKKVLKNIMKMTDDDIKANRIAFGKVTNSREYMKIFEMSFEIWEKYLGFS